MSSASPSMILALFLFAAPFAAGRAEARRYHGPPSTPPPSGTGRLRNNAQGMCLDVDGWAAAKSANVLLWECNGDPDQVWSFTPDGELREVLDGTCLDAAGYDGAQGANVDIYRCESLDDQRWTLVPRGPGTFELHNNKQGLCLDVSGRAGPRGGNVLLWACDGGADQLWSFEPHAPEPSPRPAPPPRRPYSPPGPPSQELPPPSYLPPPPPPQPREVAAERPRPMDERTFRALVTAVRNESFSEGQIAVVQQAATRNYFRVGQLRTLIDLMSFSATKLRVLEIGAPRLVDRGNAFGLQDAFTFTGDKESAREILRRSGI